MVEVIKFEGVCAFGDIMLLLLGCVVAFFVSLFIIRFILNYIKKNKFTIFGVYRVILGVIIILFFR